MFNDEFHIDMAPKFTPKGTEYNSSSAQAEVSQPVRGGIQAKL